MAPRRAQTLPLLLLSASLAGFPSGCTRQLERPNIVLILADDLGWNQSGCYGLYDLADDLGESRNLASVLPEKTREPAGDLVLNFRTSAVDSIRVAILDRDGRPLDGFGLEQCPEIYGDEIARTVSWGNGGGGLAKLKGKAVRLHFMMEDADLFSIQFRAAQAGGG